MTVESSANANCNRAVSPGMDVRKINGKKAERAFNLVLQKNYKTQIDAIIFTLKGLLGTVRKRKLQ